MGSSRTRTRSPSKMIEPDGWVSNTSEDVADDVEAHGWQANTNEISVDDD